MSISSVVMRQHRGNTSYFDVVPPPPLIKSCRNGIEEIEMMMMMRLLMNFGVRIIYSFVTCLECGEKIV